ncbi:MAG: hypothetical protein ACP5Q0_03985, partial [Halothiobacillus sp.]
MKLNNILMAGCILLSVITNFALAATPVFINEIHYDNSGTDVGEAVEIAGPAGTDLTGWSLVLYNGGDGKSYKTYPLSGALADSGAGFGFFAVNTPGIQNGAPDGMALVNATNQVVQFLSYEGALAAVDGPAVGMTSVDIGVTEGTNATGTSLQLKGAGANYEDFVWAEPLADTFGLVNRNQTFNGAGNPAPAPVTSCGQPATKISAIQGATDTSPLINQTVTVEAVVTAAFQGSDQLKGFFIEEEAADQDADPLTSEGVFVFDTTNTVAVGDKVRFGATVVEFNGLTELKTLTGFEKCATGETLPVPVIVQLPVASLTALEAVEGMRMQFTQPLFVADNYNLARYGQFYVSASPRLFVPTNVMAPGAGAIALAAQNKLNRLLIDDG